MQSWPVSIHYFNYRYQGKIGKLPANIAGELQIILERAGKKKDEKILVKDNVKRRNIMTEENGKE